MTFSKYFVVAAVATLSTLASAETITFDDLSPDNQGTQISNGYHGLYWDNFYVMKGTDFGDTSGYHSGTVSSPNIAFNGKGDPASFYSNTAFNLLSVNLTKAHEAGFTHFDGWVGGVRTYQQDVFSTTTGPTLVSFVGWTGLNVVTMSNGAGANLNSQSAIDNLSVTAVPEPESYAMLLAGLALVGGLAQRRKQKTTSA